MDRFGTGIVDPVCESISFLIRDHAAADTAPPDPCLLQLLPEGLVLFAIPDLHEGGLADISHVVAVAREYITVRADVHR